MKHLLTALLIGFSALPAASQSADAQIEAAIRPVKLVTVESTDAAFERRFFGRLRAKETVDLAFQVGGQVQDFPATEGASRAKDELIAQLDLAPFRRNLQQAEVNLAKAERDVERLESLSGNTVSEVQLADARTQRDLAEIALEQAQEQLADATLTAPFDALVARREVAAFTTVGAGTPVVRLHDMSELRVDIDVPEVLFRKAKGGDGVDLVATFPSDDREYPLVIREFEAETASIGQTFQLTLAFTERPGGWALPGASATVLARAPEGTTGIIEIPQTALIYTPDRKTQVMVFEPNAGTPDVGTVSTTNVTVEIGANGTIHLLDGIETGREIVATGASLLRDGDVVRRFTRVGE